MKNKINKKVVILISIAIMVLGSASVFAQYGRGYGNGMGYGRGCGSEAADMVMIEDTDIMAEVMETEWVTAEAADMVMAEDMDIITTILLKNK